MAVGVSVSSAIGDTVSNLLSPGGFLVRFQIELDEKPEVAGENCTSEDSGRFRSRAVSNQRHTGIRPVSVNVVRVG